MSDLPSPPAPKQQATACVAPENTNVLIASQPPVNFVLLWPSFAAPTKDTPAADKKKTGDVKNHWHYKAPATFTLAQYDYDDLHAGTPLEGVHVDVFGGAKQTDFNDYATMRKIYTTPPPQPSGGVGAPNSSTPNASTPDPSSGDNPPCRTRFDECIGGTPSEDIIDTQKTTGHGLISLGLTPGDYILYFRGRFALIDISSPGGPASTAPDRHNGVDVDKLSTRQGRHPHAVKIRVCGDNDTRVVEAFLLGQDANGSPTSTPLKLPRYLEHKQKAKDITTTTPYVLYVLPLVCAQNKGQWDATAESIRRAFSVTKDQAVAAMKTAAVLDLAALAKWECSETTVYGQGDKVDELLKQTLLVSGTGNNQTRTIAYDHVYWSFASVGATEKTRATRLPLGEVGFFSGDPALYKTAKKTKNTYGRFSLRALNPPLEGDDISEVKTRLILWGSQQHFVDLRNKQFDQALLEALVRYKFDAKLFRLRVDGAHHKPDPDKCVVTSIIDDVTYRALDGMLDLGKFKSKNLQNIYEDPVSLLGAVAGRKDPLLPGTALLYKEGYCRLLIYAVANAMRRRDKKHVRIHSGFRSLDQNRKLYLDEKHDVAWRLADDADPQDVPHAGYETTTIQGILGADRATDPTGSPGYTEHAANEKATSNTIVYDEERGTYRQHGGGEAVDYSMHTLGKATDFDLGDSTPATIAQDIDKIVEYGAKHGNQPDKAGRLWLEGGTDTWIHVDVGHLRAEDFEYALTDDDVHGPHWDDTLIVDGKVTRGADPVLGAKVELLYGTVSPRTVVATAYSDRNGNYSLCVRGQPVENFGYFVQASFDLNYPFQVPQPSIVTKGELLAVPFTYPGAEIDENEAV